MINQKEPMRNLPTESLTKTPSEPVVQCSYVNKTKEAVEMNNPPVHPVQDPQYCVIRPVSKIPNGRNWAENTYSITQIENFLQDHPNHGYGLVYGENYLGFDVDNAAGRDLFAKHFGCYPHEARTISWSSGKNFSGEWQETTDENTCITVLFLLLPHHRNALQSRLVGAKNSGDLRTGKTQSVLPSNSLHPGTGKPYRWVCPGLSSPPPASTRLNDLLPHLKTPDDFGANIEALVLELLSTRKTTYTDTYKKRLEEYSKKRWETYQSNPENFNYSPTSFFEYEIEPLLVDHPEFLYPLPDLRRISSYRCVASPLHRESKSGSSLVLHRIEGRASDRWVWKDWGDDIGGTALYFQNLIRGRNYYPTLPEGWAICAAVVARLNSTFGLSITLPLNAYRKGVLFYRKDADSEALGYLDHLPPLECPQRTFSHSSERLEVLQQAAHDGYRFVLDQSGTGAGKTHSLGEAFPYSFNHHNTLYKALVYCHPTFHRNPQVPALRNWAEIPVRHSGISLDDDGYRRRTKLSDRPTQVVEPMNCIRSAYFDKFYSEGLEIPLAKDKAGDKENAICVSCPMLQECKHGQTEINYRHRKAEALNVRKNPRLRFQPNSLPYLSDTPEVVTVNPETEEAQESSNGRFSYQESVGIFDEISTFELITTKQLNLVQFRQALDWFTNYLVPLLNREELENGKPKTVVPPVLLERLTNIYNRMMPSLENRKTPYGLTVSHGIFAPLSSEDIPNTFPETLNKLQEYTKSLQHNINAPIIDDLAINSDPEEARFTPAVALVKAHNLQLVNTDLFFELIRVLCGQRSGFMGLYPTKRINQLANPDTPLGYVLNFTQRNEQLIEKIKSFGFSVFLDATVDPAQLCAILGIEQSELLVVKQESINKKKPDNLVIKQVIGFGRLGQQRSKDTQGRIEALHEHLAKVHKNQKIGVIDLKAYTDLEKSARDPHTGYWGKDHQGTNNFQDADVLCLVGTPTPNLSAAQQDFSALYGRIPTPETELVDRKINAVNLPGMVVISREQESSDLDYRYYLRQRILANIEQAVGRLRANRREHENLTIYLVTDFATDYEVELYKAHEFCIGAAPKKSRKDYILGSEMLRLKQENAPISRQELSQKTGISSSRISEFFVDVLDGNIDVFDDSQINELVALIYQYNLKNMKIHHNKTSPSKSIEVLPERVINQAENSPIYVDPLYASHDKTLEEQIEEEYRDKLFGVLDNRKAIKRVIVRGTGGTIKTRLNLDETRLDLHSATEIPHPPYTPLQIPSLDTLRTLALDIETAALPQYEDEPKAALDPSKSALVMVGLRDDSGQNLIIKNPDESGLVRELHRVLMNAKLHGLKVIYGHNIYKFDLPYLMAKFKQYGLMPLFSCDNTYTRTVPATSQFGRPMQTPVPYWGGKAYYNTEVQLIDTLYLVAREDNVKRTLPDYSLKTAALSHGRKERRLELDFKAIANAYHTQDPELLEQVQEYLIYDLEDSELLFKNLIPQYYYQLSFVPNTNLQSITLMGEATKWQKILEAAIYPDCKPWELKNKLIEQPTDTVEYEGGYTYGNAGVFRNVAKIDVSSMYPSIMLTYGIHSAKDVQRKQLGILDYLYHKRLEYKALKSDKEAQRLQAAMKVLINSAYGFFNTGGIPFNDPEAAVLVTAYGRALIRKMVDELERAGGTVVEVDTDGIIFSSPVNNHQEIFERVRDSLPTGINIDELEFIAKGAYIPVGDLANRDGNGTGQRKNYVVVYGDDKKSTIKGKFRKRNFSRLEREFPVKFIEKFILEGDESAQQYYLELAKAIADGEIDVDFLSQTKTVPVSDKKYSEQLKIGEKGTKITVWYGFNGVETVNKSDGYSASYYLNKLRVLYDDLMSAINLNQRPIQLKLF